MSLVKSIKSALVPVHPEGYKFVAAFFVVSLILGWVWDPLFYLGLLLTGWCAYFFRDPERVTPIDDRLIISPADGIVSAVGPGKPPKELGMGEGPFLRISVFMNVFSCHINRAPVRGTIKVQKHTPGKFLNADLDKASEENERNGLVLEGPNGDIAAVQIAGLVARRIVPFTKQGDVLSIGQRFGLIRFGSRVDLYLPEGYAPRVSIGQTSIAGESILAEFGGDQNSPLITKG